MEAIQEHQIYGADLNRYYENNSVQVTGQDNKVTYVHNRGGGQVTIINQYFPPDYLGPRRNTTRRHSFPPPDRPGHMPPHSHRDTTSHCSNCARCGCPRTHPHPDNHPLIYLSGYPTSFHDPKPDSTGSSYIPVLSLADLPLLVPNLTPILPQDPSLVPPSKPRAPASHGINTTANPAYTRHLFRRPSPGGAFNETQYPSILSLLHQLRITRAHMPLVPLHSSTSGDIPLDSGPRSPSTISRHDHESLSISLPAHGSPQTKHVNLDQNEETSNPTTFLRKLIEFCLCILETFIDI